MLNCPPTVVYVHCTCKIYCVASNITLFAISWKELILNFHKEILSSDIKTRSKLKAGLYSTCYDIPNVYIHSHNILL